MSDYSAREEVHHHTDEQLRKLMEVPQPSGAEMTVTSFRLPWSERELAEAMGLDYDEIVASREDLKRQPQEVQDAVAEVQAEVTRRTLWG